MVWSRRASRQISQVSSSVRFPHSRQKRTRSFTSAIAAASAPASSLDTRRRWKASRCAVRWPTPGRRVSCATRLSTEGLNMGPLCLGGPARPASGRRLVETAEAGLEQIRCDLGVVLEQRLEGRAVDRDAADRRLRADAGGALALVGQERQLAEELAGPELAESLTGLDLDRAFDHEEHPAAGRARMRQVLARGRLELARPGGELL